MRLDDLRGKRVLITAGASGICAVVAERFAEQGARVHVCDVDAGALRAFSSKHPAIGVTVADVTSAADVERLYEEALGTLGGLDVVVAGAGIAGPVGNVEDIAEEDWRRCLEVNITGVFLIVRRAVPILKRQRSGSVVIISSNYGLYGQRARAAYVSSKWALVGLTKTLAMELGPFGVRADAICPGNVEGERIERIITAESRARGIAPEELRALWNQGCSMRTFVTPHDVASLILFVCSEAGSHISGQALAVDGYTEFV